jgi:hypothetical protein
MTHKHETPQAFKTKLRGDVELINKMKAEIQTLEKTLQDVIAAYIMGAGLPQTNIRFDEEYDLLYDEGVGENYTIDEVEDLEMDEPEVEAEVQQPQRQQAQTFSSENRTQKPRIR